ncbi:TonB-dependent receptor [Xanthomonas sp. XNM01]|uniref:TonB-dependent receptor n=1 Tax=Xanthomonas sp. XNM01 TaxID=2769289 RepID=UPI00177F1DA7|nr:TonB-dependent receptor [Xanthomonas sp. XNM01]MBD9370571.1 TonB-dependent receptor [Xanthomonas sp. XNM01]
MIKPLCAAIGAILLSGAFGADAQAQQTSSSADQASTVDLDNVIVTGTRIATSIDKIPGAISVVSKEKVEHTLALTEDATAVLARTVPGYAESSQAMSNSGETLRGRIALRLFDGIPQGSPLREGNRNGTFTDMGLIGRIEVINGPSASEGIGAAGGIINYLSKVPTREGHETTITTRYSSQFGTDSAGWKLGVNHAYKSEDFDALLSAAYIDRGISYDGDGRRIGMNTSGSVSDSEARNLYAKVGYNFGEGGEQRLQLSVSDFSIEGKGNYIQVEGCRPDPVECPVPTTNTSERGSIYGSKTEFNDFRQVALNYSHGDLFGGTFAADIYWADQAMRYLPEDGDDRQLVKVDDDFDETQRIFDQSEITSKKKGLRTSWARGDLFGLYGLQLRTGIDIVEDEAAQRLALTDRLWVPPMEYSSVAPYAQLTWDVGPVTVSGGLRREDGELHVDSYTTTAYRDKVFVQGGTMSYTETMKNFGAIWRINDRLSTFASYGEGFGLANVGIPLRNINARSPCREVSCVADLQPIVVTNKEVGFNWVGGGTSFGASYYDSKSPFGSSLSIDPITNDFVMTRAPVRIKGFEANGEYRLNEQWKFSGIYSRIRGKTSFWASAPNGSYGAGGLNKPMGVLDVNPDKIAVSATWKFLPNADATLGATMLMDRHLRGSDVRPHDGATYSYTEDTEGYTLWDLGVNYQLARYGKITVGIENLLDKQYILSWSQVPGWQNYWAGRGRMTSLTYTVTF